MSLVELRVANLAVLRGVILAPGRAVTALTGESGAGKTLCITALRLALGARVECDLVSVGASSAVVAAVFDDVPDAARAQLQAHGIGEDELLTLSREIATSGRGTSRVNGALVSLATLRAVGETLVEVTAQGESHRLLRPGRQRELLDAYGGPAVAAARREVAAAVLTWREAQATVERVTDDRRASSSALSRSRELVEDLGPLDLRAAEELELAAERRRLRHAAGLRAAMEAVHVACSGGAAGDSGGVADQLASALAGGASVAGIDATVDAIVLEGGAQVERLRDLGAMAREAAGLVDVDDRRLAEVEERRDVLERVRRRHGSLEAAIEALATAEATLSAAGRDEWSLLEAERTRDRARDAAAAAAAELSRRRRAAAEQLGRDVTAQLHGLELSGSRFRAVLRRVPEDGGLPVDGAVLACSVDGVDVVDFRFTAAADGVPLPLAEGPSGGELSRVALALRAVVAAADDCPTLVLDEVDTGVGGETAARVGETLQAIGERRQVLVVTHRAEIAARADDHVLVRRPVTASGRRAAAEVRSLDANARLGEISRLMSGRDTTAATTRAAELLIEGRRTRVAGGVRTMAPR